MTHAEAAAIAASVDPSLFVVPYDDERPHLFAVKHHAEARGQTNFHLPALTPDSLRENLEVV